MYRRWASSWPLVFTQVPLIRTISQGTLRLFRSLRFTPQRGVRQRASPIRTSGSICRASGPPTFAHACRRRLPTIAAKPRRWADSVLRMSYGWQAKPCQRQSRDGGPSPQDHELRLASQPARPCVPAKVACCTFFYSLRAPEQSPCGCGRGWQVGLLLRRRTWNCRSGLFT